MASRTLAIKHKLPMPENLAELLTLHSFEVEAVEKTGKDWVFDIAVPTNRADCFSHIGIARECAANLNVKLKTSAKGGSASGEKNKRPHFKTKDLKTGNFIQIEVQNKNDCPRYTAAVVTDVKVGPSPKWLQERLRVCGLRPINNIVDVANYVMLETGQPLHAFDFEKISDTNSTTRYARGKKIIVRRAAKGEKITTLDGEQYDLDEDTLIIADGAGSLAIAGIKGGKRTEIDSKTKTIVLESANFSPSLVRASSRKLSLKTEASLRFEHGVDSELAEQAIKRTAALIVEIAGGKPSLGVADFYPNKPAQKRIKIDVAYLRSLLGVEIHPQNIQDALERLGIQTQSRGLKSFVAVVPSFRPDLVFPEDIIEEISRLYGYDKIGAELPRSVLIPARRNEDIFWQNETRDMLKSAGFTESYNYSFIGAKESKIFGYKNGQGLSEVLNPVSAEYQYMRPSLIVNLLKSVERNQKRFSDIKIFEIGKIFSADAKETRMLTGVVTDLARRSPVEAKAENAFYLAKGAVDSICEGMGIDDVWYDEYRSKPDESPTGWWNASGSAAIKIGDEEIGFVGEITRSILDSLEITRKVAVFDINFEKLQKFATEEQEYSQPSKYPAAIRDIAVLVPNLTKVDEVSEIIETAGGKLVRDVDLFDMYEGEGLPDGKKNLAFHVIYQAEDRTLTSGEIDKLQNKIIAALEENVEWEVRK